MVKRKHRAPLHRFRTASIALTTWLDTRKLEHTCAPAQNRQDLRLPSDWTRFVHESGPISGKALGEGRNNTVLALKESGLFFNQAQHLPQ